MTTILDSIVIPIQCPKCHRQFKKTVGVLKRNMPFRCICGMRFKPNFQVKGFQKTERALQQLERTMRSLGAS